VNADHIIIIIIIIIIAIPDADNDTLCPKPTAPANGYIGWHTNWDLPGCNIIFTYSPTGNGYWRHIDPAGSRTVVPNGEKLVHIPDVKGWHCKVGQFGRKDETDKLVWHSAFAREPRLTVSYVIFERKIWENMVDELLEGH